MTAEGSSMGLNHFPERRRKLMLLLFCWLLVALAVNFMIAGPNQARYLNIGRKIARQEGEYYLPRARLLDRGGTPLAWSEKYFDLLWLTPSRPCPPELRRQLERILDSTPNFLLPPNPGEETEVVIYRNATADQLLQLDPLLQVTPQLNVRPRVERRRIELPEHYRLIGETKWQNGHLIGVSGAEQRFDRKLSGIPGRYEVMLDRHRNWIYDTWKITREPVPGSDVVLDLDLDAQPTGEEAWQ